jgi:predicted lipoprotein
MNHRVVIGGCGLAMLAVTLACPAEQQADYRGLVFLDMVLEQLGPDAALAAERADELHTRIGELCASPDAVHLDVAQDAWMQLREPWQRLQVLPIDDGSVSTAIDFWPVRPDNIEESVALGITTQAELDALGVAAKGMPAIEYLLWDPVGGDEVVLAALTDNPTRCTYAELLAADVATQLEALTRDWSLIDASYVEGPLFDPAVATDALVNAMINGIHEIDDMKLGKPLGRDSGIGPDPTLVESRLSDRSLLEISDGLAGFERAYLGDDEHPGLTRVVADKNIAVDANIRAAIDVAKQAVANVPEPLRAAIESDPNKVAAAEQAVQELRLAMILDVAGLLGVTVALTDNDGD